MKKFIFPDLLVVNSLLPFTAGIQTTLYWDINGTTAGAGTTPTGTWGTSAFWNTLADGTGATGAWVSGDNAFFSAGSDASGAFTVAVSGAQTVAAWTINQGTITLSGSAVNSTSITI